MLVNWDPAHADLSAQSLGLLDRHLAAAIGPHQQMKQAQRNVVGWGGAVSGTLRIAATRSFLRHCRRGYGRSSRLSVVGPAVSSTSRRGRMWPWCGVRGDSVKAARVLVMEDNLMIVDVRPGSGGGVRAADEILRGGSVPDVFVSGDISGLIAQRAEAVAIQKPLRVAELAQAIRRVLRAG